MTETTILGDVALWEAAVPGLALIAGAAIAIGIARGVAAVVDALRLWLNLH